MINFRYAVVILNWNSYKDTLECIESITKNNLKSALIIIIDNNSSDDSVAQINSWANINYCIINKNDMSTLYSDSISTSYIIIYENNTNSGFSAGCNIGLDIAKKYNISCCIFLNNDTVVYNNALDKLSLYLEDEQNVYAVIPLITIFGTNKIWNCGGKLYKSGFRKYYYPNHPINSMDINEEIRCTFITGCCVAVRTKDFSLRGGWCTDFFFGEEDFEFSMWSLINGKKLMCLPRAQIAHKVGQSTKTAPSINKIFVYYLNRFIHMLRYKNTVSWNIWRSYYSIYVLYLLINKGFNFKIIIIFLYKLNKMANSEKNVSKGLFFRILNNGFNDL